VPPAIIAAASEVNLKIDVFFINLPRDIGVLGCFFSKAA
jgi:hypothetical protein